MASNSTVTTPLADQELRTGASTGVSYWEGAIDVRGTRRAPPGPAAAGISR